MEFVRKHILDLPVEMGKAPLGQQIEYLFQQQLATWQMARNHYRQFMSVQRRTICFDGFRIELQHNPARARSTCADLSKPAIENRKCFLCAHHLPAEQMGLAVLDKYLLLVNPFPIFNRHYTVSGYAHEPQNLSGRLGDMLDLAKLLEGFTVFYNGPRCGASAPDHFHFQAVPFGELPIDTELALMMEKRLPERENGLSTYEFEIKEYLRTTIVVASCDPESLVVECETILGRLPFDHDSGEPMMNVLASFQKGHYRLVLFPRKAQRPSCYYREGEDRILVSPASVELGGIVVAPREEDFLRISANDLRTIFEEVSR